VTTPSAPSEERVLVWVGGERDGAITRQLLERSDIEATVCRSAEQVANGMVEGAGAALVSEELVVRPGRRLVDVVRQQPPWSDFPFLVFSPSSGRANVAAGARLAEHLRNVTFLDRPVRVRSMVAAVQAALRGRRRQYEARRAIASRDEFLAMLGHELRNPLAAARLAAANLERNHAELASSREVAILKRQTTQLTRMVDDLLDVARVTHGKVTLREESLYLDEVLLQACEACAARAEEHGVALTQGALAPHALVRGDRERLEQVFTNLLTNALKYTPRGGSVRVGLERTSSEVIVAIEDTGVGIAPGALERIFDVFTQVDATLDRAQGGLGLGLALVRSIVELHAGSVEACSDGPGRGSCFRVRLPLADASPAPRVVSPSPRPARQRRVVVVEDLDDVREMLVDALRSEGHDVAAAGDGPAGAALIVDSGPDVAFVDIGLPGFDGHELARQVRARGVTCRLIALTGYGRAEDKRRARDAGFDAHLSKPVSLDALSAILSGELRPTIA
jgi:signal transduction histidine kinase/CheY-like chemotaxis protein